MKLIIAQVVNSSAQYRGMQIYALAANISYPMT